MVSTDRVGMELSGPDEAREEMRRRALVRIGDCLRRKISVDRQRIRLRDSEGRVLLDLSLLEAAYGQACLLMLLTVVTTLGGEPLPV
jgi:hypothetical protein